MNQSIHVIMHSTGVLQTQSNTCVVGAEGTEVMGLTPPSSYGARGIGGNKNKCFSVIIIIKLSKC